MIAGLWALLFSFLLTAGADASVQFTQDARGHRLRVDDRDFFIKGVVWSATPPGYNYSYDLFSESDAAIRAALSRDFPLMRSMGINAIRVFQMIPPRWIKFIYKKYGIRVVINPLLGRYGMHLRGRWVFPVDYSDAEQRKVLKDEVLGLVRTYKDTPGVLFWMLGNENNYGFSWTSTEIENLPVGERDTRRAKHFYSLVNEISRAIKGMDAAHPVVLCNGDIQYLSLIRSEAPDIDALAANVYRGRTMTDLFQKVQSELAKPVLFSEMGSDAFNAQTQSEDGMAQAEILRSQWADIYRHAAGQGAEGNAVGGFVFQWNDEWWKYKQTENLERQDTHASWANGGYAFDYVSGENNMNEEWFGITAKRPKGDGYRLRIRPAVPLLRKVFAENPYDDKTGQLAEKITQIPLEKVAGETGEISSLRFNGAQLRAEYVLSEGDNSNEAARKGWKKADHQESLTLGAGWHPSNNFGLDLSLHAVGHAAENKMDEIFYENREDRIQIHRAHVSWKNEFFELEGYYRLGHGGWSNEGDFFGLYQESWDIPGADRYNAAAPSGLVFTGNKAFSGFKVAAGPELYWGARPMAIAKYQGRIQWLEYALVHAQILKGQDSVDTSSLAKPGGRAVKTSLWLKAPWMGTHWEWGLLQAGVEKTGDRYTTAERAGANYGNSAVELRDENEIQARDTMASKVRLTGEAGDWPWSSELSYRGLVADGGVDSSTRIAAWALRPSERGNQSSAALGFLVPMRRWTMAPYYLYQKPLQGPLPGDHRLAQDQFDWDSGNYTVGLRPRNLLSDPFAVLDNREMSAAELLISYDPSPDSSVFAYNNFYRETSPFAASLDIVFRKYEGRRDASLAVTADGALFAFASAPPAAKLWDLQLKTLHRLRPGLRLQLVAFGRDGQANGTSERLVKAKGLASDLIYRHYFMRAMAKWNDWGPYDYHRDVNLTFPFQGSLDIAYGYREFSSEREQSLLGLRYQTRRLDKDSPRLPLRANATRGSETEWTSYVQIAI